MSKKRTPAAEPPFAVVAGQVVPGQHRDPKTPNVIIRVQNPGPEHLVEELAPLARLSVEVVQIVRHHLTRGGGGNTRGGRHALAAAIVRDKLKELDRLLVWNYGCRIDGPYKGVVAGPFNYEPRLRLAIEQLAEGAQGGLRWCGAKKRAAFPPSVLADLKSGASVLAKVLRAQQLQLTRRGADQGKPEGGGAKVPHWDVDQRKLWLGDTLLLHVRYSAPTQVAIIDAFQAGRWAPVAFPEKYQRDEVAKAASRLSNTLMHQARTRRLPRTISLRMDGTGELLCWEIISANPS